MAIEPDLIFKGSTRPAMIKGVPMTPAIGTAVVCFLSGLWGLMLLQSVMIPVAAVVTFFALFFTMRSVAKKDDQRFRQIALYCLLRWGNFSRGTWGATSYSPTRFKKR